MKVNIVNYYNLKSQIICYTLVMIEKVAKIWGIDLLEIEDLEIPGALRVKNRNVVKDSYGKFYILEEISISQVKKKEKIAEFLNTTGIETIRNYYKTLNGKYVAIENGKFFMLTDYINHVPLSRPDYLNDGWRGEEAGKFLKKLHKVKFFRGAIKHDYSKLFFQFKEKLKKNDNKIFLEIEKVFEFIEKNLSEMNDEKRFCMLHADFHPMNILWGKKDILSIIDWEFFAYGNYLYDIANFLGCIGSENEKAFFSPLAKSFLKEISVKEEDVQLLISFILYVRIVSWLQLWLKKKDKDAVDFEIFYINWLFSVLL